MDYLIYSNTERGLTKKFLSNIWEFGSTFVDNFDGVVPADDWGDVYAYFGSPAFQTVVPISQIQFWGHGYSGRPMIGSEAMSIQAMATALRGKVNQDTELWFRACDVFSRDRGLDFASDLAAALNCKVVGHTRVISLPWLNCQSGGFGLRPGERPHWDAREGVNSDGTSKYSTPWAPNTCSVLTKRPPRSWFQ